MQASIPVSLWHPRWLCHTDHRLQVHASRSRTSLPGKGRQFKSCQRAPLAPPCDQGDQPVDRLHREPMGIVVPCQPGQRKHHGPDVRDRDVDLRKSEVRHSLRQPPPRSRNPRGRPPCRAIVRCDSAPAPGRTGLAAAATHRPCPSLPLPASGPATRRCPPAR